MRPTNVNEIAHRWILEVINPSSVVIDATVGNGKDTYFLATHCAKVYGFDIQQKAILITKRYTACFDNIILIQAGHENMSSYVKEDVDLVIFNLGYLPFGEPKITTLPITTLKAIKEAGKLLKVGGSLFITFYIGHPTGKQEHDTFINSLSALSVFQIQASYTYQDRQDAPILYHLKKL